MKQSTRSILKLAVGLIAGAGASALTCGTANSIISNSKLSRTQRVLCNIGVIVFGAMAGDAAERYATDYIDNAFDTFDKMGNMICKSGENDG